MPVSAIKLRWKRTNNSWRLRGDGLAVGFVSPVAAVGMFRWDAKVNGETVTGFRATVRECKLAVRRALRRGGN